MSAAERIAVMEGELDGIDLVEILQVVGIGRQYTGVELHKADHSVLGTLFIKSGKVVTAVAGAVRGREAFFQLFQQVSNEARKFFHVFRMETPTELPEPIGALGNLLLEALDRAKSLEGAGPQKTSSGVLPRPALEAVPKVSNNATDTMPPQAMPPQPMPSQSNMAAASRPPLAPSSRRRPAAVPSQRAPEPAGAPSSRRFSANDPAARQGSIPSGAREGDGPLTPHRSDMDGSDVLKRSGGGGQRRRIVMAVASPKGGSGKTTIALNLSLSFARQERSVILVDADINGDVLSSIQARDRAEFGAFDVLLDRATPPSALLRTVLPHFRIMPAMGQSLPELSQISMDHSRAWQKLLRQLGDEAEIVIVDCPAGMFGTTRQVMTGCTHLLGVLQAELIASRSFGMFNKALESLSQLTRPEVVGIVLNMLQSRHTASVNVLQDACSGLPRGWLLDTAIPRSDAFLTATEEGLPVRLLDDRNPPAVSWLFDTLASELTDRLELEVPERKPRQLLI